MTDVKDSRNLHTEDVNSSDGDIVEKGSIVGKHGGGHAESLNDLEDPDAGKSPEERAALVRIRFCRNGGAIADCHLGQATR